MLVNLIFGLFLFCISFPVACLCFFAIRYGYNARCETCWWIGPGAAICVKVTKTEFYWCPFGLIGYGVRMLDVEDRG